MTDYTLSSGNIIKPYRCPWGAFPTKGIALSTGISSNVIRIGQVVQLDNNSTSYQNCIVPAPLSSSSLNVVGVVGVAAESPGAANGNTGLGSTNSQGTICMVWDANPNCEFIGYTRNGLLNSTIVGQPKELTRDSTLNIDLINLAASSLATPAKCVIITGFAPGYASGDSGGAVTFRFNTSSGFLAFYH